MEHSFHGKSVAELKKLNTQLTAGIAAALIVILLLVVKLFFQSEIIIQRTPGMPSESRLEKTAMDKKSQLASLLAVTSALVSINPANSEFQKELLYVYLAPEEYTRIASEINTTVDRLKKQSELGSYYFVFGRYEYDPLLDRHFVVGEVHTVNAARDTPEEYVYEYSTRIDNYRLVVEDIQSYKGKQIHNSEFLKGKN